MANQNNRFLDKIGLTYLIGKIKAALSEKASVIEAVDTLPAVAVKGTICKLTVDLSEQTQIQEGDRIADYIIIENIHGLSENAEFSTAFLVDGDTFSFVIKSDYKLYLVGNNNSVEIIPIESDVENDINKYDLSEFFTDDQPYYVQQQSLIEDGIHIYNYIPKTIIHTYISTGTEWQLVTTPDHVVVTQEPDLNLEPVDDIPIGDNTPSGDDNNDIKSKPNIYCEVAPSKNDGQVLVVTGADEFLTNDYIPILLRKTTKRNGRGWHLYKTVDHYGEGNPINMVKIQDVIIRKATQAVGSYVIAKAVTMFDDFDILSYVPEVKTKPRTSNLYVSHGKKQIYIYKPQRHTNFKAKWGLAFIKRSDFPGTNTKLDLSKLVTNIAPFCVYYRWLNIGVSDEQLDIALTI